LPGQLPAALPFLFCYFIAVDRIGYHPKHCDGNDTATADFRPANFFTVFAQPLGGTNNVNKSKRLTHLPIHESTRHFYLFFTHDRPTVSTGAGHRRPRKQIFEIGLNVTNTISSFIGSSGSNISNDPYLIYAGSCIIL